jgi:hypothetical protein
LDVVAKLVTASTSELVVALQAVLELQDRLLLPDNSQNEKSDHPQWFQELDQAD